MTLIIYYLIITVFIVDFEHDVSTIIESMSENSCIMEYSFNNFNVFTIVDFEDDVSTIIESMSENSLHPGVFI